MNDQKLNSNNNNRDIEAISTKLYVKYMVCLRDKLVLQSVLNRQGLKYRISIHGAILFLEEISQVQFHELKKGLSKAGLILLNEKESMLIDRIINTIIEIIHYMDTLPKLNISDLINEQTVSGEESVLKIFSDVKGMSVLQFINIQKIERAKELLIYEDMPLEEIAELLNYKNQDFLISQFKMSTGLAPTNFKQLKNERMEVADNYINFTYPGATGTNF